MPEIDRLSRKIGGEGIGEKALNPYPSRGSLFFEEPLFYSQRPGLSVFLVLRPFVKPLDPTPSLPHHDIFSARSSSMYYRVTSPPMIGNYILSPAFSLAPSHFFRLICAICRFRFAE